MVRVGEEDGVEGIEPLANQPSLQAVFQAVCMIFANDPRLFRQSSSKMQCLKREIEPVEMDQVRRTRPDCFGEPAGKGPAGEGGGKGISDKDIPDVAAGFLRIFAESAHDGDVEAVDLVALICELHADESTSNDN